MLLAHHTGRPTVIRSIGVFTQSLSAEASPPLRRIYSEADELRSAHRRDADGGRTIYGNCDEAVADGAHGWALNEVKRWRLRNGSSPHGCFALSASSTSLPAASKWDGFRRPQVPSAARRS